VEGEVLSVGVGRSLAMRCSGGLEGVMSRSLRISSSELYLLRDGDGALYPGLVTSAKDSQPLNGLAGDAPPAGLKGGCIKDGEGDLFCRQVGDSSDPRTDLPLPLLLRSSASSLGVRLSGAGLPLADPPLRELFSWSLSNPPVALLLLLCCIMGLPLPLPRELELINAGERGEADK
jgi:hypothetical protein